MSLQSLINHELDGGVGHQQQGCEGAAPQCCHTLLTGDLHDCICKNSEVILKCVESKVPRDAARLCSYLESRCIW